MKEMNEEIIRKYAKLMKELDLSGIEVTEGSSAVRLERTPSGVAVQTAPVSTPSETQNGDDLTAVTSPMVGVFYAAPTEDAEPFVKAGDTVKRGDTLCIIEAMKLMNEITAEQDGVISQVCVSNGQIVEYGTVLFKMEA